MHNEAITDSKGLEIWMRMSNARLTWRTPQSLQSHYKNHILPNIEDFDIPARYLQEFIEYRAHQRRPRHNQPQEEREGGAQQEGVG